jgi:Bacteriocin-protection, YdeI or OmpD-Associated/Domain of unknown function (DUF1905)
MKKKFKGRLDPMGPGGAWTGLIFPFSVEREYGTRGRIAVRGTMNGAAFRSSAFPMDGKHVLMVNKKMQADGNAKPGEMVVMEIEPDTKKREVELPPELKKAFTKNAVAKKAYGALSYTHQRDFAELVGSAKGEDTRKQRLERTLTMLREGTTLAALQKKRYLENKAAKQR